MSGKSDGTEKVAEDFWSKCFFIAMIRQNSITIWQKPKYILTLLTCFILVNQ